MSYGMSRRDLGVYSEASEKVLNAFKKIDQSIVTFLDLFGRLSSGPRYHQKGIGKKGRKYAQREGC
jgi:hypothetical protein